jgi:hypothetical protein
MARNILNFDVPCGRQREPFAQNFTDPNKLFARNGHERSELK